MCDATRGEKSCSVFGFLTLLLSCPLALLGLPGENDGRLKSSTREEEFIRPEKMPRPPHPQSAAASPSIPFGATIAAFLFPPKPPPSSSSCPCPSHGHGHRHAREITHSLARSLERHTASLKVSHLLRKLAKMPEECLTTEESATASSFDLLHFLAEKEKESKPASLSFSLSLSVSW